MTFFMTQHFIKASLHVLIDKHPKTSSDLIFIKTVWVWFDQIWLNLRYKKSPMSNNPRSPNFHKELCVYGVPILRSCMRKYIFSMPVRCVEDKSFLLNLLKRLVCTSMTITQCMWKSNLDQRWLGNWHSVYILWYFILYLHVFAY